MPPYQARATMRFTAITLLVVLAAGTVAQGCVTAHVYMHNCIFDGDIVTADVYDNGVRVCSGGASHAFASSDTTFCIDGCQAGTTFCVTNNARSATYQNAQYSVTMGTDDTDMNTFTCGMAGDDTEIKGTEYESCFTDNFGNCGDYPKCSRCDFKSHC